MSNHPIFLNVDTITSQILFIFSLFVDNVEMINPWKLQPSTPNGSKVIEIWKFDRNGCVPGWNTSLWIYVFCNNYCSTSHTFILKFVMTHNMGKFFGVRILTITLRRLKNKSVLRYLRFHVLGTCDRTGAKKYMWLDR